MLKTKTPNSFFSESQAVRHLTVTEPTAVSTSAAFCSYGLTEKKNYILINLIIGQRAPGWIN